VLEKYEDFRTVPAFEAAWAGVTPVPARSIARTAATVARNLFENDAIRICAPSKI
jgi:hypothetical protein